MTKKDYEAELEALTAFAEGLLKNTRFVEAFIEIQTTVHEDAKRKGWESVSLDGQTIALIHSEVSEVLEALRHGNPPDDKIPDFNGAEAELADVIIRVMDMAEGRGWRVAEAVIAKIEYNRTRPHKHGGKKF